MSELIREIIRKPLFKGMLRTHLKEITPDGARALIRTILWQDIEVIFSVIGTLPACINTGAAAIGTLAREMGDKLSPSLVKGFIGSILEDVDTAELKECGLAVATLLQKFLEDSPELKAAVRQQLPEIIAQGINTATTGLNSLSQKDPALLKDFMRELISAIDKPSLHNATLNLADALLDQKLGLISWTGALLRRRLVKLAGRLSR